MKDIHTHPERFALAVGSCILVMGLMGAAIMIRREYPPRALRGRGAVRYGRAYVILSVICLIAWGILYWLRYGGG